MTPQLNLLESPETQFSSSSVLHIHRAVVEVLLRYLHQHDPFDHQRRYGTVSGLMEILEQIGLPSQEDCWGIMQNLDEIRRRVRVFLRKLEIAPVVDQNEMSALLAVAKRANVTPSSLNLHRYLWDMWEIKALLAGVSADLAEMGRGVLRRQHFRDGGHDEIDAYSLLCIAATEPEQAEATFMRYLVRSAVGEFGDTGFPISPPKSYC